MKRHIPNTITLCNLMCGCIAVTYAFHSRPMMALLFIVMGAMFDFFDGFAARKLGVSSPLGKELDSLSDLITFGLAPATMVFTLLSAYIQIYVAQFNISLAGNPLRYLNAAAFLIAAFSALRLAKFNTDERQTYSFIGLPTPANALLVASTVITIGNHPGWLAAHSSSWHALIAISCVLLICKKPMFALKFKDFGWQGNKVRYIFLLSSVILLVIGAACSITRLIAAVGAVIAWYILLSLITSKKLQQHERA